MIRTCIALLMAVFALNAFAAADANKSSQAELETVKGIGPGLSSKILDARKNGTFKNWDDLVERVGGIGPGNAARFSSQGLTVSGAAYEGTAAPAKPARTAKAEKTEKTDKADKEAKPAKKSTKAAKAEA